MIQSTLQLDLWSVIMTMVCATITAAAAWKCHLCERGRTAFGQDGRTASGQDVALWACPTGSKFHISHRCPGLHTAKGVKSYAPCTKCAAAVRVEVRED
eukprot:9810010-Karenia_brevis.AAC.1